MTTLLALQARFCDSACEKKGHEKERDEADEPPAEEGNAVETAGVMTLTDADIAKMNQKEARKLKRKMKGGVGFKYCNQEEKDAAEQLTGVEVGRGTFNLGCHGCNQRLRAGCDVCGRSNE